jgi:hypothetical protein
VEKEKYIFAVMHAIFLLQSRMGAAGMDVLLDEELLN